MKVCGLRRVADGSDEMVLLDGGATHCLRTVANESEWEMATDIKVSLAEGETLMRQVTNSKTLITREKVQSIVPLCWITALGYRVMWSQDGCKINHPNRPQLPVKMVQGCPTVPKDVGMKLLAEVEQLNIERGSVKAALNAVHGSLDHPRLDLLRKTFFIKSLVVRCGPLTGCLGTEEEGENWRNQRSSSFMLSVVQMMLNGPPLKISTLQCCAWMCCRV